MNYQILVFSPTPASFRWRDRVHERDVHLEQSAVVTNVEQEFLSFTIWVVSYIVTTRGSSHGVHILQVC